MARPESHSAQYSPSRFLNVSKYLFPLDSSAFHWSGGPAPTQLDTFDTLAARMPDKVQVMPIGQDYDFGAYPYRVIENGRVSEVMATRENPHVLRVTSLVGGSTVGRKSFLLSPDNTLVADHGYYLPDEDMRKGIAWARLNPKYYRYRWLGDLRNRRQIPKAHAMPGSATILNNPWCHNFYHWLLEVAPRVMLLRQLGIEPDWYIVESQSGYQRRALELLGIRAAQIVQPHYAFHARPEVLYRPGYPGLDAWKAMAQTIKSAVGKESGTRKSSSTPARLYISRRKAAHRKLRDEASFENFLREWGFESRSFESMDYAEQVRLVSNAQVIVSVHGAALANLIYAQPGTRVVEICPVNRYNVDCFPRISHKMGHEHFVVLARSTRFRQELEVSTDDVLLAFDMLQLRRTERTGLQHARVA